MRTCLTIAGVLVFLSVTAQPKLKGLKAYYGLLHAHTLISDGSGTPVEAYKMAKDKKLDFFAVTEHNHTGAEKGADDRIDGVLIATTPDLYNGKEDVNVTRKFKVEGKEQTEKLKIKPLINAAKEAGTKEFLPLFGQEFSTISTSNHVNVFSAPWVLKSPNGNFKALVEELRKIEKDHKFRPSLQLNHPDVSEDLFYTGTRQETIDAMFNDYGIDEKDFGPDFTDLVNVLDPYVDLIEILSGPATKQKVTGNYYYPNAHENDYYFYLKQGFHISPSAGQDNHYKTWGGITDARTGTWIKENDLTETALFEAFRRNRTFATEDKNLQVAFMLGDSLMGATAYIDTETELDLTIYIHDSDEDEKDAEYTVELFGGLIAPENSRTATKWLARDGKIDTWSVKGNGTYNLTGIMAVEEPMFYYVKITQENTNGTDNRAWTAPIWVNEPTAAPENVPVPVPKPVVVNEEEIVYYWTEANSKYYHLKKCSTVPQIKKENLVSGKAPPRNRVLHKCKITETED